MNNPLIKHDELPDFKTIKPEHFEPAMDALIASFKGVVDNIVKLDNPTWATSVQLLEEEGSKFDYAWNVITHLNGVHNIDSVREAYGKVLPKISNFSTDLGQNKALYELYRKLEKGAEFSSYGAAQKTIIQNALRDFKLSGIDLDDATKSKLKEINQKLTKLSNDFAKNVIDSTQSWKFEVTEDKKNLLAGLPDHTIALALDKAKKDGKPGWVLTLDFPCYFAVMSYAENRDLRESFYKAYVTRASDRAEEKKFDTKEMIDEILALRGEKAHLLGFKNYAEYSLVPKMAGSVDEVMTFLLDLAKRSKAQGDKEFAELKKFAEEHGKIKDFAPWDATFYSTLYQKTHYDFSEEDLRPYFPEGKVFSGLFELANRVFGIQINEVKDFAKLGESVRLFEVRDRDGNLRGKFYADLYARDFKRSGAWIEPFVSRIKHSDGSMQYPISFLEANFTPPSSTKPALLSHSEVNTLFHEFGHTLQHILTQVDYSGVSGINGVAWDAVELPSQFMENWCWEWEVIENLSAHYETGKPLPRAEFDKLIETKNFQSAMQMLRQLEFALFDFRIHAHEGADSTKSVQEILDEVRAKWAVMKPLDYNRSQNSFSHIFAGGYAAGYYSYKWAEVLSSDAFAKFEETGGFNQEIGKLFMETILEQGGSKPAMDLFIEFRGRKPNMDALLRHSGISN